MSHSRGLRVYVYYVFYVYYVYYVYYSKLKRFLFISILFSLSSVFHLLLLEFKSLVSSSPRWCEDCNKNTCKILQLQPWLFVNNSKDLFIFKREKVCRNSCILTIEDWVPPTTFMEIYLLNVPSCIISFNENRSAKVETSQEAQYPKLNIKTISGSE